MRYQRKPEVIEAIRCSDAIQAASTNWDDLPLWFRDDYEAHKFVIVDHYIYVECEGEGMKAAERNYWIVKSVDTGKLSVMSPIDFRMYEPLDNE